MKNQQMSVKQLVQMAMLAAISIILVYLIHFPIFPAAPFMEYDPADIPLILSALVFGPVASLLLTLVVCVLQGLTVSAASGPIGIVMHFIATGSYVLIAGLIFNKNKTTNRAIIAMVAGVLTMCVAMVLLNLVLTPIFMGAPLEAVIDMLLPVIIPFNLIKAGGNSILAFIIFKIIGSFMLRQTER